MPSVCFYFQVHQPFRLKNYSVFHIGKDHFYEDDTKNREIIQRVAAKCYLPTNQLLLELIKQHNGRFKVAFSITGVAWEQFERFVPEVCASFKRLFDTGCVELLSETFYHSLSFNFSRAEFSRQVELHRALIHRISGQTPQVFRNTELIYNNEIGNEVSHMGFRGILCEGVDKILGHRSPNFIYTVPRTSGSSGQTGAQEIKCLLKNYRLSDDIAFRFSDKGWKDYPLTAGKFASWAHSLAGNGEVLNLFMDYETFGEHQWPETGIFEFLRQLPSCILQHPDFNFRTPTEMLNAYPARDNYDVHSFTSWADLERDLSAWLGNDLQKDAMEAAYECEQRVKATGREDLLAAWAKLLSSDHFYYMSTKYWKDGDVHKYFSPYDSPYDAYINYMNVLSDLEMSVRATKTENRFSVMPN